MLYKLLISITIALFSLCLYCNDDYPSIEVPTASTFTSTIYTTPIYCDELVNFSGTVNNSFPPELALNGPRGSGTQSGSTDVFVMGDCTEAVFSFTNKALVNGDGTDFKVFENTFFINGNSDNRYMDLGTVSVSIDGTNWLNFPIEYDENADGFTLANLIGKSGFAGLNPVFINIDENALSPADDKAGGDAFDLSDVGLSDGQHIKYIKIVDGCNNYPDSSAPFSNGIDIDAIVCFYWVSL